MVIRRRGHSGHLKGRISKVLAEKLIQREGLVENEEGRLPP